VRRVLPLIITLLALPACSKSPAAETTGAAATAGTGSALPQGAALSSQVPVEPVPAQLPEVVARVNGEDITKVDFERAVRSLEGRAGGPVPSEQRNSIYRDILDDLVGYRLLSQEAAARKVTVPDADVNAQLAQIQGQFPTPEAFNQVLAERKVTIDQVRADTRRDLVIAKLLQGEVEAKSAVTPEQVSDFYAKNPDQFMQGERVRASHILITAARDADAATKAQARTRAEGILEDVKGGKDFAALAKEHSQDPGSAVQGGDLGYFTQGQMVGPFNDAAFSLAPGTTSGLVETDFGFHIIRVVDKQAGRTVPLDEVKAQVEEYLLNQNRREQTEAFVTGLKAKGKIELFI
jgi:peptidyl-prolyl cis-trans isomerase C